MALESISAINVDRHNNSRQLETNTQDPRHYGCAISKARANYKTDKIKHTTTLSLDDNKYCNDNDDNFTSLKQMFVDIVSQDEHDYNVINEGKSQAETITVAQFRLKHSKQYRFVRAFDAFFADRGLKYGKVENEGENKEIFFAKGTNKIAIDCLSNPGGFRVPIATALSGGVSDPRNATLLKMFNLIDIGERTGSGIPLIRDTWKQMKWPDISVIEGRDPERTTICLLLPSVRQQETQQETRQETHGKHSMREHRKHPG